MGDIFPCPLQEEHFPTDLADLWQTDKASHLLTVTGIKLTPLSRAAGPLIGWTSGRAGINARLRRRYEQRRPRSFHEQKNNLFNDETPTLEMALYTDLALQYTVKEELFR